MKEVVELIKLAKKLYQLSSWDDREWSPSYKVIADAERWVERQKEFYEIIWSKPGDRATDIPDGVP